MIRTTNFYTRAVMDATMGFAGEQMKFVRYAGEND